MDLFFGRVLRGGGAIEIMDLFFGRVLRGVTLSAPARSHDKDMDDLSDRIVTLENGRVREP